MKTKQRALTALALLALAGAAAALPALAKPSVQAARDELFSLRGDASVAAVPARSVSFWPTIDWRLSAEDDWMKR